MLYRLGNTLIIPFLKCLLWQVYYCVNQRISFFVNAYLSFHLAAIPAYTLDLESVESNVQGCLGLYLTHLKMHSPKLVALELVRGLEGYFIH